MKTTNFREIEHLQGRHLHITDADISWSQYLFGSLAYNAYNNIRADPVPPGQYERASQPEVRRVQRNAEFLRLGLIGRFHFSLSEV
jgi:hypothetical protein